MAGSPHRRNPYAGRRAANVRAITEIRKVENVEMGILKQDERITWINVTAAPIPLEE